ncbi:MAG: DUF3500 domain-containing protein [Planctomycetes bacterium]|nr:DUF3500 domain-containing protein [Planctomycetota bacterium]
MRRWVAVVPFVLLAGLLFAARRADVNGEMTRAAQALLVELDAKQIERLELPFGDRYRRDWHFVPRERRGLPLAELGPEARGRLRKLLATALSERGLRRVDGIVELEGVLRDLESTPTNLALGRDPERYTITLFGKPSEKEPWAWRYEGHHLSLSFTSVGPDRVAVTPFFFGASPARVAKGPSTGKRVLGEEEDAARAIVRSFDEEQRKEVSPAEFAVPSDVVLGPQRGASFQKPSGLPATSMSEPQRIAVASLVELYASNLQPELATSALARARDEGVETLHFLWVGGLEEGEPHYWRVQGKSFAIELDNTQDGANHVHTLWRDFKNDFGEDDLARHYAEEHEDGR